MFPGFRNRPARPVTIRPSMAAPKPTAPKPTAPVGNTLKRALLVGINYVGTQYELAGCVNDVVNMQNQLKVFFPKCQEYQMLTDSTTTKPTKANILAAINWLVTGLKPGENIYMHFSGHGGQVADKNGDEPADKMDECIYPCANGALEVITDDELRSALVEKVPAGSKAFVVLDCCHSGTAVDLRYLWQAPSNGSLTFTENTKYAKTAGNVLFLSGCRDPQTAADTVDKTGRPAGALTMALLDTWGKYGAVIKTKFLLWDVRKFLKTNGYSQVPELSTSTYIDLNQPFDLGA